MIKDTIADITLQQVLTRAKEFDVVATMNLEGDFLSMPWLLRSVASVSHRVPI